MKIQYLKINNFRSFSNNTFIFNNPQKINLLIGTNNSGKSNILSFLNILGTDEMNGVIRELNLETEIQLRYPFLQEDHNTFKKDSNITFTLGIIPTEELKNIFSGIVPNDDFYITYLIEFKSNIYFIKIIDTFFHQIEKKYLEQLARNMAVPIDGNLFTRTFNRLNILKEFKFPKVEYLSEFRRLTDNRELRTRINTIINFDHTTQENRKKKILLCNYFKDIFGFDIDILIPNIEKEIQLSIEDNLTPLSSLGTGYQQVLLIAFVIITSPADIICIDEPELHLHPKAQRALLNLMTQVEKQFFLATHSNNFLDYKNKESKIYQVININKQTQIFEAKSSKEIFQIIEDLGIRPSEIYQTNGIIWVEGPTERIYIKKWLSLKYPELIEGLQFTFQFYGGKLLSHYSINDEAFKNYLNLLLINRNGFIVMDSDMKNPYNLNDIRDTKKRIIEECKSNSIGYWVTFGKEIENYLTEASLTRISKTKIKRNLFESLDSYFPDFNANSKVIFAHKIEPHITLDDIKSNEDLEEKIDFLAKEIEKWNS